MLDKILVSHCLVGGNVRYNSKIKTLKHPLLNLWKQQNRLISVCPEVAGGLSVPREPSEIQPNNNKIVTSSGLDVTKEFNFGAKLALNLALKHQVRFAILKESSPSCGSSNIYDGSFTDKKIAGQGITSKILTDGGIRVFSENNLEELKNLLDR